MDLKIFTKNITPDALNQVHTLMNQEAFKNSKVRIMPDVHEGLGSVIGFTGNLGNKVIPNVVGVDIGCGMLTVEIENKNLNLFFLDDIIHRYIPAGFKVHNKIQQMPFNLQELKAYSLLKNTRHLESSLGTLGGGNHFIEIGKNSEERYFLIIHTGSRNLGKQIAEIYQKKAINYCKSKNINIPNDLAYLEDEEKDNYLHDMKLCQLFAEENRKQIANTIIQKANLIEVSRFQTIHNYIGDDNIVRKGAISAYKDEVVLIPINMKDGSLYGLGLGNTDWNNSGPHGAGRILSRTEARRQLSLIDFKEDMRDVYSSTVQFKTIDESPRAYKDINEIIEQIKDTVKVLFIIKPIYNFKVL